MPTHQRDEGHEVQGRTTPHDGIILTNAISSGEFGIPGGTARFELGSIVGSLVGDLLLTVTFTDGERVTERLSMAGMLHDWIGEIAYSKSMRDNWNPDGTRKVKQ